ncbi:hypothetical protein [Mycobacterium avium]|uniref:hypothetical protein n=1 Tax=Mycobacterium avium TaxID=1764 RepID=UPI00049F09CB|nr:hypothetical protein [Mycobacterium avium]KDO96329.1 hypothetical protein MAVA5_11220 [Mycobacterium avium subsp. hominissuis A5]
MTQARVCFFSAAAPEALVLIGYRPARERPNSGDLYQVGSVDKAIDGIQFLLSAADVPIAIAPQQMPGEPIPTQNGEIYFGLSADQVAVIATQLAATRFAWAGRRAIHRHEHLPVRLIAA